MYTTSDMVLLRIFITDSDRVHSRPVYELLLNELKKAGAKGATVLHGIAGFGQAGVIHSAGVISASDSLPLVVEVCESEERMQELLPGIRDILDRAGKGALITQEKVRAIQFKPH